MKIDELMRQSGMTRYRLSKSSGVPYSTISDIVSGKARLEKCSADTIYHIAKALGVSMEELLAPCFENRSSFELYKSNVCHHVEDVGDIEFIAEILESGDIRKYYEKRWYPECFYLLAMLDYLSRLNRVPICTEYDDLRRCCLKDVIYPAGVLAAAAVSHSEEVKKQARRRSIPEFMRFNIVESEVRNVV